MTIKPKIFIADADKREHLRMPANVLVLILRSLTGSVRKHLTLAGTSLAVLNAAQLINVAFLTGMSVPAWRYVIQPHRGTVAEGSCRGSDSLDCAGDITYAAAIGLAARNVTVAVKVFQRLRLLRLPAF